MATDGTNTTTWTIMFANFLLCGATLVACKGTGNGPGKEHPLVGSTWLCNVDEQMEFQPTAVLRYDSGRAKSADVRYESPERITLVDSKKEALAFSVALNLDSLELKNIASGETLNCHRTEGVLPYKEVTKRVCTQACDETLGLFERDNIIPLRPLFARLKRGELEHVRARCVLECSEGSYESYLERDATAMRVLLDETRYSGLRDSGFKPDFYKAVLEYKENFCRASKACKDDGLCHPNNDFSRWSPLGLLREKAGPIPALQCEPKTQEDCTASAHCKDLGACTLKSYPFRSECSKEQQ